MKDKDYEKRKSRCVRCMLNEKQKNKELCKECTDKKWFYDGRK